MRWAENVSLCIQGLVAKTEGKSPAGRPRRRWGIILKCIFKKYESRAWTGVNWFRRIKKSGGLL
jgi:hypothetical protein